MKHLVKSTEIVLCILNVIGNGTCLMWEGLWPPLFVALLALRLFWKESLKLINECSENSERSQQISTSLETGSSHLQLLSRSLLNYDTAYCRVSRVFWDILFHCLTKDASFFLTELNMKIWNYSVSSVVCLYLWYFSWRNSWMLHWVTWSELSQAWVDTWTYDLIGLSALMILQRCLFTEV